jgi:DNA-binding transcriptional regulator LsrR (DeoR family)
MRPAHFRSDGEWNHLVRNERARRGRSLNAVLAARRYFVDGASKSEIAGELGVSRFKVARLLDSARRDGVVRIEITAPAELNVDLSIELASRYGLRQAVAVRLSERREGTLRDELGRTAAELLGEIVEPDDVLGISWGRTLHAVVENLGRLPGCAVVQMVGSVPTLDLEVNSLELVRRLAEAANGPVYPLHVPLLVDTPEMAEALRREPHVARTVAMFGRVTKAVVGIGAWVPGGSSIRAALPEALVAELDGTGAVADVCSTLLDDSGHELESTSLRRRLIAIGLQQLEAIPDVMAIAGGAAKARAIRAALESGLVHRLVTDEDAARLLLEPATEAIPG